MTNFWKALGVGLLAVVFAMPAMAGTRDRKRDGSCGGTPMRKPDGTGQAQAKKAQQRKRDGTGGGAGQCNGSQQRKRNGSCQYR